MADTLADRILSAVSTFRRETATMLQQYGDVPPEALAQVTSHAERMAADVTQLAHTVSDGDDLARALALIWCELKGEWVRHNLVMQYQLAETGETDPAIWLAGSVISGLLAALEPQLPPDAIERLDQVLNDPLHVGRPDTVVLAQLREQHQRNGRLVRTISDELNGLFRAVLDVRDRLMSGVGSGAADPQALLQALVGRVEASFSLLRTHLRQDSRTPYATLWTTLQGELQTQSDRANLRCQISDLSDPDAAVDAQQVEPLLAGWFAAARFLMTGLATEGTDRRQARDKSLHPHLDVRCQSDSAGGQLILTDDGPGLPEAGFPPGMAAAWQDLLAACRAGGLTVDYQAVEGVGSTLILRWEGFRYQQTEQLLIVRRGGNLYAVPADPVRSAVPVDPAGIHRTPLGRTCRTPLGLYPWRELPTSGAGEGREGPLPALALLCEQDGKRLAIGVDSTERLHATVIEPIRTTAFAPPPFLRGVVRFGTSLCLVIDPWHLPNEIGGEPCPSR